MNATSTTGRAALVAANGRARRPAEPPQGDLSHAEVQRDRERRDCCQCENVANAQSQYPIGIGKNGTGNTSTMTTFSSLPKGWEVKRFKCLFSTCTGISFTKAELVEEGFPVLSYGQIHSKDNPGVGVNKSLIRHIPGILTTEKALAYKGDFLFADTSEDLEGCGNCICIDTDEPLYAGSHVILAKQQHGQIDRFLAYEFASRSWRARLRKLVNGVKVYSVTQSILNSVPVWLPPLPEQKAIVAYLDAETGRIDKAIAAEEKMIALLQERREIVINEAVGGGDLSHAEAQRGRARRGWEVRRLKNTTKGNVTDFIDGDWIESDVIESSGIRYLTTGNVGPGYYKEQGNGFISESTFVALNCTEVFPGDLLISRLNEPIGRTCIVPDLGHRIIVAVDNVIYRPDETILNKKFIVYLMNSRTYADYMNLIARGSTMHRISRTMLGNIEIHIPPLPEQEAIVERLDRETGKIDRAIEVKRRQIELLRERRQIVIDEVMTGKVKVA